MQRPLFLTLAEVVQIHADQIKRYGGREDIRDYYLLESAMAQPEATFGGAFLHKDLYAMAAAYVYHICCNHPFMDGNKRTGLTCALVFLELNGIGVLDPKGLLYKATISIADGKMQKDALAELLRQLPVYR